MKAFLKKKISDKKGFTLAELLVVVAIIAILVAISIPIFTAQLEKSRESTDLANIRSAYAECSAKVLDDDQTAGTDKNTNVTYTPASGADGVATASKTVDLTQTRSGWQYADGKKIGGKTIGKDFPSSGTVTVTVSSDGSWTCQ